MKRILYASVVAALALFAAETVLALPRFSARTGKKCQACHVNPSGGGMRQTLGVQYGRDELPVPSWSEGFQLEDFSTLIANVLGVGADFRTLYFVRLRPDTGSGPSQDNAFWQMQGDLYLNFRIAKKVNLYLKKGLYSGFEAFGLLNILPANGHVKIGKFIPNFGLRLDDHTAYVRTYTGLSPAEGRPELTGLEVGVAPGPTTFAGGLYNAEDGFAGSGGNEKAWLGRGEVLFAINENVAVGGGANAMGFTGIDGTDHTYYGGFAMVNAYDVTLIGEFDFLRSKLQSTTTSLVAYAEASYPVITGLDLKVAYDFYDPDKDLKTGSLSRYSFGFEFFPISGVEVRPLYRLVREEPTDTRNDEIHILFHLYL
jgi:hypothetical protein